MKKFKVKIDTPWCSKGTIYHYMPYGTYVPDRTIGITPSGANSFAIDHPEKYHDLFEPVEERALTPFGKWVRIFERVKNGNAWENLAYKLSIRDQVDVDQICKEVFGEG